MTEIVSGFGQLGVAAERVAGTAVSRMRGCLASDTFAGPYLADQLLLPFALASGGSFTTVKSSQHSLTAAEVSDRFLGAARRRSCNRKAGRTGWICAKGMYSAPERPRSSGESSRLGAKRNAE